MTTATITASDAADLLDADEASFCIDTALSWDGSFPEVDADDYLVEIGTIEGDRLVLVSRRYVGAVDADDASSVALDAVAERHGFDTDDEGAILPVELDGETGIPAWVVSVRAVVSRNG